MPHEISITRVIDAPRERVFRAFTDPQQLDQWWGPQGFTNVTQHIDVRPSGRWQYVMHGPAGETYDNLIRYETIDEPARITYAHSSSDGSDDGFHTTLTFEEVQGQTLITMSSRFATDEKYQEALAIGAIEGGHSTLDKLAEHVALDGGGALVVTRLIHAPLAAVWRAWTEPEQLMRWWGPANYTSPRAEIDLREGGRYLFAMRSPEGQDFYSVGRFVTIAPQQRIVYTDSFGDADGNVVPPTQYGLSEAFPLETLVTVEFEDLGDRTRLTVINRGIPIDDFTRYARQGWTESMDKLAAAVEV